MAAHVLKTLDIDLNRARNEVLRELDPNFEAGEGDEENFGGANDEPAQGGPAAQGATSGKNVKTPALKAFGRDLTEIAAKGEMDPVIGRKNEIERVIQILCRRTKNNPVLIGEAGVGKTAIVEGLAQEIHAGNVPELLRDKKVITLDLALMVAGTKYRGQFEERIKAVMEEIRKTKNVILFIDEMHTIVGAGSAEGAMDASNIIKPALSRGELQCIGATTLNEYRKYIEKDSALERRFQSVKVDAPSVDEAIQILKGLRPKYEQHHRAKITDEAIEQAVKLSDRYLTARFLPDKAIDIMDEAGARARIRATMTPSNLKDLEANIETIRVEKETAIKQQDFEKAAALRDKEKAAKHDYETAVTDWRKKRDEQEVLVDNDDIFTVVSKWTGVPLTRLESKEMERLLNIASVLHDKVIGQDTAVDALAKALRRSRADLKDPNRPIGSFIFLGPTGVGKTHLAKCLAEYVFGEAEALIQLDMSEYMEKFNVSRLVGSPPGYVGYEEGGQLTEKVRRRPYSVVLFDEIEKAHPDVWNILLQILEDGQITDSLGRKVDFRNTIILMTSNVGADLMRKQTTVGFGIPSEEQDYEAIKSKLLAEAKKTFKPEFLNRLTDIVVFHSLNREHLSKIVSLEIDKVQKRLKARNVTLTVSESALQFLIDKGYEPTYGARPLRRAIERYLEDPLAEELIRGDLKSDSTILIEVNGDKLSFKSDAKAAPEAPASSK